jgi:NADH dehydrogenase
LSEYARTKASGEQGVLAAFENAAILRPSIIFGPEDHFFNRFASMTRFSAFLPLIGGGNTRFQPVYVGDVADAAMAALRDTPASARIYELGGPRTYSFRQLMEIMLAEIDRKRRLVSISWNKAAVLAKLVSWLPNPPLTADQIEQLKTDNIVTGDALTLHDLGVSPTALELILPTYLERFRTGGRFYRTGQAGL